MRSARLAQVVEDELGLEDAAELAGRSVEAILRPMAYQTLECDRRGGLAARERREELSDPVPVLCDPIEVTRSFLPVDHGVQRAWVEGSRRYRQLADFFLPEPEWTARRADGPNSN